MGIKGISFISYYRRELVQNEDLNHSLEQIGDYEVLKERFIKSAKTLTQTQEFGTFISDAKAIATHMLVQVYYDWLSAFKDIVRELVSLVSKMAESKKTLGALMVLVVGIVISVLIQSGMLTSGLMSSSIGTIWQYANIVSPVDLLRDGIHLQAFSGGSV